MSLSSRKLIVPGTIRPATFELKQQPVELKIPQNESVTVEAQRQFETAFQIKRLFAAYQVTRFVRCLGNDRVDAINMGHSSCSLEYKVFDQVNVGVYLVFVDKFEH